MSDFRFINDKSQDDTGRTATYLQKSLPIAVDQDLTVTINPTSYVNTFVFEGEQTTPVMIVNIAAQHNLKSSKGDYLELIFAPTTDNLEVYMAFVNVDIQLTVGQKLVAYFQYDGTNWLYTNPQSSGGGGGAVNTVNNIAPINGNVNLGTIGTVLSVNNITPVNGNVDLGTIGTVLSVNNITPVNGNVTYTDGVLRLKTKIISQPDGTLFQSYTIINQLPNYTLTHLADGINTIVFDVPIIADSTKCIVYKISDFFYGGSLATRTIITTAPPFDNSAYYIYTVDKAGTPINDFIGFDLEFEIYTLV